MLVGTTTLGLPAIDYTDDELHHDAVDNGTPGHRCDEGPSCAAGDDDGDGINVPFAIAFTVFWLVYPLTV
eukprot:gene22474-53805_t